MSKGEKHTNKLLWLLKLWTHKREKKTMENYNWINTKKDRQRERTITLEPMKSLVLTWIFGTYAQHLRAEAKRQLNFVSLSLSVSLFFSPNSSKEKRDREKERKSETDVGCESNGTHRPKAVKHARKRSGESETECSKAFSRSRFAPTQRERVYARHTVD